MTNEKIDDQTREDWRDLGFFYDHDKDARCWRLIGSRSGLLKFCGILNAYVAVERNVPLSEHEHYGPYWYLTIITWNEALITEGGIRGTFDDLRRLAEITKHRLENAQLDDTFEIDKEYGPNNEYKLRFEVREDGFDPASPDPLRSPSHSNNRSFLSRLWSKLRAS